MKRRGVLGLLGGALAAGPAMAKQAVDGLDAMSIPSLGVMDDMPTISFDEGVSVGQIGGKPYDHGEYLREQISELLGISAAERKERIADQFVSKLDPDLAVNRSMALWAKVAEQKRRNYEDNMRREHRQLKRQLTNWLKKSTQ